MTLCPTDVVTTPGSSVVMRVAGKPGSSLLWYSDHCHNSDGDCVIYTGEKMDYTLVDERYFISASRNKEIHLTILDVKSSDAGRYIAREDFSGQTAHAALVVMGKLLRFSSVSITCRAVALHCCKAYAKVNRKMENSTPPLCKIVTPKISS